MSEINGKIGQYQLIAQIKESATTLVYKGFQPALNRDVVVKILKRSASRNPEIVQRFRQQGDFLSQFNHPRLLEIYENGESEGLVFRAERLAENGLLKDYIGPGPQYPFYDTDRNVLLFKEIVEGVDYIHNQGYTHGNLTPSNIYLDPMLHPLLTDFGLPVGVGDASSPFLAPEQISGGLVDRRADIYALGVLLFATLTGAAPHPGILASPRMQRPELPEDIDKVIFKAMSQNPDQRFQSVNEFFEALQLAFLPPPPPPIPAYAPPPIELAPIPAVSQTVTVAEQKRSTNWLAIVLIIMLVFLCCSSVVLGVGILNPDWFGQVPTVVAPIIILPSRPPAITQVITIQPPAITQVNPTKEPKPTDSSQPTNPPPPTYEPNPTLPPQEQATNPPEQPEQTQAQPTQPAADRPPVPGLPVCGSVGLVGLPMIVLGIHYKKRRSK